MEAVGRVSNDVVLDKITRKNILYLVQELQCPHLCMQIGVNRLSESYHFRCNEKIKQHGRDTQTELSALQERSERVNDGKGKGGELIFAAASLMKPVMSLLVLVLVHARVLEDSFLEADAYKLLNKHRVANGKEPVPELDSGRSVKQFLLHDEGFPRMTEFLLSPGGSFMVSEQQFLDHAALIANATPSQSDTRTYSTCNYILVGLLLKEMLKGKSLELILQQYVFGPLKMYRTTISPEKVREWIRQDILLDGHNVAADFTSSEKLSYQPHINSEISMMAFGLRTCVNDFARMLQALLDADKSGSYLTEEMANVFFSMKIYKTQGRATETQTTFVGLGGSLSSSMPGSQSSNSLARQEPDKPSFSLGEMVNDEGQRREALVHYKAGMIDGFSCCFYVSRLLRTYVIAFSNAIGPLECADYACQMTLQRVIALEPQVDFWKEMVEPDLPSAQKQWEDIYQQQKQIPDLTSDIIDFIGIYQADLSGQQFEVTGNGEWILKSPEGVKETMEARVVGESLQIYPSAQHSFGIDRLTAFRQVKFAKDGTDLKFTTSDKTEIHFARRRT